MTDPLGNHSALTYDAAGNLTRTQHATGRAVTRTYTDDNMVDHIAYEGEPTTYDFAYTPGNLVTSVTDQNGRGYTHDYDTADRLAVGRDTMDPSIAGGFATRYTRDAAGRVIGLAPAEEGTRA